MTAVLATNEARKESNIGVYSAQKWLRRILPECRAKSSCIPATTDNATRQDRLAPLWSRGLGDVYKRQIGLLIYLFHYYRL